MHIFMKILELSNVFKMSANAHIDIFIIYKY